MTERRQVDRELSERVVRLDERMESIINIMAGHKETVSRIEKDVHRVREIMEQRDDSLNRRLEVLEKRALKEETAFNVSTFIGKTILWLIGGAITIMGIATGIFKDIFTVLSK